MIDFIAFIALPLTISAILTWIIVFFLYRSSWSKIQRRYKFLLAITIFIGSFGALIQALRWYDQTFEEPKSFASSLANAERGDTQAMVFLGNHYAKGRGTPQDYEAAVSWYLKAARLGEADAATSLGNMFRNGEGVRQDWRETIRWYRIGAARGDYFAMKLISLVLENAGRSQDLVEAYKWSTIAASLRPDTDLSRRNDFAKKMTPEQILLAETQAKEWSVIKGPLTDQEFEDALPKIQ